jgi:hypothetical protein
MNSQFINKYWWVVLLVIPLLSTALHWNVFDKELQGVHLWRQAQTQTVIQNFAEIDRNILDPRVNNLFYEDGIKRMEFPLMQWVYSWFYEWTGGEVSASRWATFIFGLVTVLGIFFLFRGLGFGKTMSALVAWCFNWSPLFYYYTLNPLPDNMCLMFTVLALAMLAHTHRKCSNGYFMGFLMMIGVAALIKIPYVLLAAGGIPFMLGKLRVKDYQTVISLLVVGIIALIPSAIWYAWVIPAWGDAGIVNGISDGGLGIAEVFAIIWQTVISMIPELFVNYGSVLFLLLGIYLFVKKFKKFQPVHHAFLWVMMAFLAYYFYEINMITTVHDYYLFPFLPILFLAVGFGLRLALKSNKVIRILSIFLLLILPLTAYLRADSRWRVEGLHALLEKDLDALKKAIPDNAICLVGNDISTHILLYLLDHKGLSFSNDELSEERMEWMVNKNVHFMYSSSLIVENDPAVRPYLKKLILDTGEMRVYELAKPQ